MAPILLRAPSPLPSGGPRGLSILTYNVLLPNSVDAWWTYKMYSPGAISDPSEAAWPARSALLREEIRAAAADVVCLQEVAEVSFGEDWAFMAELGYGGSELYKKGRFRPATFWRPAAVSLVSAVHRDRALITAFALAPSAGPAADITVINCHLQAGPEGARRLRQVHDAVESAAKAFKKNGGDGRAMALLVCGDLNGDERSAAVRLLEDGSVDASAREDGEPVTSKLKKLPLAPLTDCAATVASRPPPPTLVVAELISALVEGGHDADTGRAATLSAGAEAALAETFAELSGRKGHMDAADVARWLVRVNLKLGRGSEFRAACREMDGPAGGGRAGAPAAEDGGAGAEAAATAAEAPALPADGVLTFGGFRRVYEAELRAGKYWGVSYDMHALGHPPPAPAASLFCARYDRVYASEALELLAVRDSTSDAPCPNRAQPSDHLPVGVTVRLREGV